MTPARSAVAECRCFLCLWSASLTAQPALQLSEKWLQTADGRRPISVWEEMSLWFLTTSHYDSPVAANYRPGRSQDPGPSKLGLDSKWRPRP